MVKKDIKTQNEEINDINPKEAFKMIKENKNNLDLIILDIRTLAEYDDGHIERAENIDYSSFDFEETLEEMDRNRKYIIYCRSGVRSSNSCDIMKDLGFHDLYNIKGGIDAWKKMGFPVHVRDLGWKD